MAPRRRESTAPGEMVWPIDGSADGYRPPAPQGPDDEVTAQVPALDSFDADPAWDDPDDRYGLSGPSGPSDREYLEAVAAAEAVPVGRRGLTYLEGLPAGRVKVVERFRGPRLKHRTGLWRRLRSLILLILIGLFLAGLVAALLSLAVWGISIGIHHVTNSTSG